MRLLVTGATGYIGRSLLPRLLARSGHVRCVVRDQAAVSGADDCVVIPDLWSASDEDLDVALAGVDAVVHLAWYVDAGDYLTSGENARCLTGTLHLAERARIAGVQRFVGIGTCLEYDTQYGYLTADTPLAPISPYACAKAAAYLALSSSLNRSEMSFAWARLFHIHGGNEDPRRLTSYLRSQLEAGRPVKLTSGRQIRDYSHIEDVAGMLSDLVFDQYEGVANICSGVPITIADFVRRLAADYDGEGLLNFGERPDRPDDPPCIIGEPWAKCANETGGRND